MPDDRDRQPHVPPAPVETEADEANSPASTVATLESELAAAREEARQASDRFLRERADAENLKKRAAREKAEAIRFGTEALVKDLLPVVDNLERAVQAAEGGGDGKPLVEGVSLVLKALLDVLARHGITRVEALGTRFDPAQHEAVAHVESAEHEPNAVIDEHQAGYRLHDRLLRPAMVTVSKGRPNLAKPTGGD
jgi:molecular chaperone GrpE